MVAVRWLLLVAPALLPLSARANPTAERCEEVRIVNREPVPVRLDETQVRLLRPETPPQPRVVEVETTAQRPLHVRAVDERQPFQWTGEAVLGSGQAEARLELVVGARRFALQTASTYVRLPRGQAAPALELSTVHGRAPATFYVPLVRTAGTSMHEHLAALHTAAIGADARTTIVVTLRRTSLERERALDGEARVQVTLAGYLE